MQVSDQQFEDFIAEAIAATSPVYKERLQNIAFIVEDDPSPAQRQKMGLLPYQTLLGLYEGVPLPARGGATKLLPDKITLFKNPLLAKSASIEELRENIRHTVWHEVAHYFGLDHSQIYKLDGSSKR